jgi:hypothetical protein
MEMPYCFKLKVALTIKGLRRTILLRDDEKREIFVNYCLDMLMAESGRTPVAFEEVFRDTHSIKQVPFEACVFGYLQYLSYTDNACQVDALRREAVAQIFYRAFLTGTASE